jgi:hypothetical protein
MTDEFAIQETINRYSEGASRADWEQVLATYLPDGVWEIPALNAKFEGHKALRDGLMQFSGPMDYMVQLNSPALIKIDGDKATARSVIRECGKFSGRDEALEVLGFYADDLVRTANGWKFRRRLFELKGMHSFAMSPVAT